MRRVAAVLVMALMALGSFACGFTVDLEPTLEVGTMQSYNEEVARDGADMADVEIRLGAGEIDIAAGDDDMLFTGEFRTNVVEWAPEVSWDDDILRIEQGNTGDNEWTMPGDGAENEWTLAFSPEVEFDMDIEIGAARGNLDFSGLSLTRLSLETGASEMIVSFNEPNPAEMGSLNILAGAASLRVEEVGNASPERMSVRGGAGSVILDLSGDWGNSSRIEVESGVGALTLRIPENLGVRVEVSEGLGSIQADSGLIRSGNAYQTDVYGETEYDLVIEVTVGIGSVELDLVDGQ